MILIYLNINRIKGDFAINNEVSIIARSVTCESNKNSKEALLILIDSITNSYQNL
jgi:hypothetical protein